MQAVHAPWIREEALPHLPRQVLPHQPGPAMGSGKEALMYDILWYTVFFISIAIVCLGIRRMIKKRFR